MCIRDRNKAYATFEERDRLASLGGGVDKIEKQHESGKMTARERIEMLLDKGTFVELDKLMVCLLYTSYLQIFGPMQRIL